MSESDIAKFITWAKFGDLRKVEEFVNSGVDINAKEKHGRTALMMASRFNKNEVVEFLVGQKANIGLRDNEGMTALMLAIEGDAVECVKILTSAKANIHTKDKGGNDATIFAIRRGNLEILSLLVENGAKITRRMLMEAEHYGRQDVIEFIKNKQFEARQEKKRQAKIAKILANKQAYRKEGDEKEVCKVKDFLRDNEM